jgi:hypothetical protein
MVGLLVALGLSSTASAGGATRYPIITVDTGCVDGQGVIEVTLLDGSYVATYNVTIDDVKVGTNLGAGTYAYSPYAAGNHHVVITYTKPGLPDGVNDDTWTVEDCGPPPSTTAAPTTEAPTTSAPTTATPTTATPTTTAAGSGAVAPTTVPPSVAPALPATGQASGNVALIAALLTALGGALLFIVTQARRA